MKTVLFVLLLFFLFAPLQASQSKPGHTHDILEVKFNADATKLFSYSAGDGWLILWEVKSGRVIWRTKTEFIQKGDESYTLTCFAFSPSEKLIASGSGNGTVQLWDAQTGRLLWRTDAHKEGATAIEFSPDGKDIASAASPIGSKSEIKILRVDNGQISQNLESNSCIAIAIAFAENGKILRAGNVGGAVTEWSLETGKRNDTISASSCRALRNYEWETSFTPDLKQTASRTGEKEVTVKDIATDTIKKKLDANGYRIYSRFSADGQKLVVSGYNGFTFYDLVSGVIRKIEEFSRTGSTIDLSLDGTLFAEGGSWGKAAIKITNTQTGQSLLLDGRGQNLAAYQPGEVEMRLAKEKQGRLAYLREAQMRRDNQAAIDTEKFKSQVYIKFDHYGEMIPLGQQRLMESGEPNKSRIEKPASEATAVWVRLHNDSPLPIQIPTRSFYMPNPKCFYEYADDQKLSGLCPDREISVWYGVKDKKGKVIPSAYDTGSNSILLPQTSVLFALPLEVLQNAHTIYFSYAFLKETEEHKIKEYGKEHELNFRQADLPAAR
ncbi:MAG: hypothetical protein JNM09_22855 [Blastocatellia bacterium]|nr:hypothetical protein [Blastocatellia bacterium]